MSEPIRVAVTNAQSALVSEALEKAKAAQMQLTALVNTLGAGHVPEGWSLVAIEADGLVFEGPPDAD